MNGFANGLCHIELTNGNSYYFPCDIEWGLEGKYLIFPVRYYKMISDDLFVINSIKILQKNKIICYLENAIRLDNGQILYEVTIQLDSQNFNKILKSNISNDEQTEGNNEIKQTEVEKDIPEAIFEPEQKEEIIFKQSEIFIDLPETNEISEKMETKEEKPTKKAKWYKPWRYFW